MMIKYKFLLIFIILYFISCVDKFMIPDAINDNSNSSFGAGDTTYLQLTPIWDETHGISQPIEISIIQDGRILIADSSQNSIFVLDQDGDSPSGFDGLKSLLDNEYNPISPIDVDADQKMNIFFVDGSQRVFIWNHYWNSVGINSVSTSATFIHSDTGADTTILAGSINWLSFLNNASWEISSIVYSNNQVLIDSLLNPYLFYDGRNEKNAYLDPHYQTDSSQFTGISAPADNENMIFVTDNYGGANQQYRIIQIDFQKSLLLALSSGDTVWAFTGEFGETVVGYGTGAGTVSKPLSLDIDYNGNLYYTQTGDFFPVHMIIPNLSGDFSTYSSGFQPNNDDIMNADFFSRPLDIAVDNNQQVYIVDNDLKHIGVFNSNGDFFKYAGYKSSNDTVPIMTDPVAVTVDDRGVIYVCDKTEGAIFRYKLSNSLDEDIIPEN